MENQSDQLFDKVHALAAGLVEGSLTPQARRELETLLLSSAAARKAYIEHVQETSCLRWLCVDEFPDLVELASSPEDQSRLRRLRRRHLASIVFGGGVACLIAIATGIWFLDRFNSATLEETSSLADAASTPAIAPGRGSESKPVVGEAVATITGLESIRWQMPASGGDQILSRCAIGDHLRLRGGSVELTFDAGAQVTVFGPADFDITSATSIRCRRGRVTTLVDHRGKGFSIETPQAKVVDIGTQFGLNISDKGETEVVVFQGSVDLDYNSRLAAGEGPSRRMQQGDGCC